jgi:O-acetyl-ADP-ribose deacetylase (regulator of RNase III)
VSGAGELRRSNGVKKIFHAAAVVGQPGRGYVPISEIGSCVRSALEMADADEFKGDKLKSILFPLMGTGTGRGELEPKARELILAAISYLKTHPESRIQQAYFLAWSEKDLEVCRRILDGNNDVVLVKSPRGGTASKKSARNSARPARR